MNGYKKLNKLKLVLYTGAAFSGLGFISYAQAQVENATGIADPGRASQQLMDQDNLPDLSANVEVSGAAQQNAPQGAENITFELKTLEIEGVSTYSSNDLDSVYGDKLGTTVSLADVYGIADDLTRKYRNDGYILTQVVVPPQTIDGGNVKLRVVEGFVDKIIIQGEQTEHEKAQILKYADNLRANNILDAKQMERYLLLINDLPGVQARSILSPSTDVIGASDLTIIVERKHAEAEVSFNNHGSRYLGPYQLSMSGSLNSPLGFNEKITAQFVGSGDRDRADELLFGSLTYEQPISKYGTVVRITGSTTSTEPGDDLDQYDVHGNSQFAGLTLSHPFIRSRTTNLFGRASFDLRDVDSKNNLEPNKRKDRIRSVRLGTTYQFMDTLYKVGINSIDVEFSQGVDVFGASDDGTQDNLTRSNGKPQYTKIEFNGQRLQRVTESVNFLFAGSGQWAATPLLSSEEFGIGGQEFGRGYDSSEIVGDDGISGKIEIQWNQPYAIDFIQDYQLYTYFDIGRVWNQNATTSAGKRDSLSATGLGIRANITEQSEAGVGVAFPLTRERDVTNDRDPRYYFNVSYKF